MFSFRIICHVFISVFLNRFHSQKYLVWDGNLICILILNKCKLLILLIKLVFINNLPWERLFGQDCTAAVIAETLLLFMIMSFPSLFRYITSTFPDFYMITNARCETQYSRNLNWFCYFLNREEMVGGFCSPMLWLLWLELRRTGDCWRVSTRWLMCTAVTAERYWVGNKTKLPEKSKKKNTLPWVYEAHIWDTINYLEAVELQFEFELNWLEFD